MASVKSRIQQHLPFTRPVPRRKRGTEKVKRRTGREGKKHIRSFGEKWSPESSKKQSKTQKANQLSCMYTNANNLSNKRSELLVRIDEIKPDIIGITEVWQKEDIVIPGYHQAMRKDRKSKRRRCVDHGEGMLEDARVCVEMNRAGHEMKILKQCGAP